MNKIWCRLFGHIFKVEAVGGVEVQYCCKRCFERHREYAIDVGKLYDLYLVGNFKEEE